MIKEYTLEEIEPVAKHVLEHSKSRVLLFNGEMGVGKTTLIKALVKQLGSLDNISSPTYSLVNEYKTTTHSIFHFDLYRIEEEEELYNFGIEDYLNTKHWLLVEWPDLLTPLLQSSYTNIKIESLSSNKRKLTITNIDLK